ncbi:hypothetical protein [Actinophytocola sp. NPDC049390]|uniref:hypothetical protein n=1 Tax=Actinophytocola sp. NPDC049390 TaxID=3363894 RepID=UPI003795FDDE
MTNPWQLTGILLAGAVLGLGRPTLFLLAVLAHRRWRIPVHDVERLINACFRRGSGGARRPRRPRRERT